jgi:hypothetical protein
MERAWPLIFNAIQRAVEKFAKHKYHLLDSKLQKLGSTSTNTEDNSAQFYPRVVNGTAIRFTKAELSLTEEIV